MANDFTQDRMQFLRGRQQARKQEQGTSFGGKGPFGAPRSGFLGERSYLDAMNEDGELADLESQASTGRGAALRVGAAAPGIRATRPGVGSLSLYDGAGGGDYDPLGEMQAKSTAIMRQSDADAGQAFNLSQAKVGAERQDDAYRRADIDRASAIHNTPAWQLGSGRQGAFEQIAGDIDRTQATQNVRAEAGAYFDPLVTRQREAQQADEERKLDIRYNREGDYNAKIAAAQIAADAVVRRQMLANDGSLTKAGLTQLGKQADTASMFARPFAGQGTYEDLSKRYAQGQGIPTPGGVSDDQAIDAMMDGAVTNDYGKAQLEEYWPTLTPEQQQAAMARMAARHRGDQQFKGVPPIQR